MEENKPVGQKIEEVFFAAISEPKIHLDLKVDKGTVSNWKKRAAAGTIRRETMVEVLESLGYEVKVVELWGKKSIGN